MPTETAPQPVAAPAAVPAPTPVPAATPAASAPPISSITKKPISDAAHSLFKMLEESGDPMREIEDDNKPEPTPAPAAKTETPAATPAKADDKPVVKVSKKPVKRPDLPVAAEAAPAPVAAAPSPQPTDDSWKDSLLDDERTALEDAAFAENVNPKHKGLSEKMGRFFRDQKKYLEEHPDADENDPAYKQILARMPTITAADKREIVEARIEERVTKKHEGRFADFQHEIYVRDEEPKVENEAQQIRKHMAFNALPKEMLDVLKEKGLPELQKQYADELEIAGGLINTLTDDAKELLRITRVDPKTSRTLASVATDASNPKWAQHNRIADMVNAVCDDFQKTAPQTEQVRNGKWFVTRDEWAKIPANQRSQFWTFTNSENDVREMINRAMGWMPNAIESKLKEREESLKQRGYVRQRSAPVVVPAATPPTPVASASTPRPSAAPAPNSTPSGQQTPGQLLARRLAGG